MARLHHFILKPIVVLLVVLPFAVFAQSQDYVPLTKAEIGKPFRLRYVGLLHSEHLISSLPVGPYGATISRSGDETLVVSGDDKSHKKWSFQIEGKSPAFPYDLYVADLDRNGYKDVVLAFPTGGNGLAPLTHIITVMFDQSGRPIPFEADGYSEHNESGIPDLVDMDNDGKAELIYMNFDDGYWITSIYKAANGRWERIKGRFGRHNYPLYTRFTFRPNHKPVIPKSNRHPYTPDLSNLLPKLKGSLLSSDVPQQGDPTLWIRTKEGKRTVCKPNAWFGSFAVLVDDQNGRRIGTISANRQTIRSSLDKAASRKYTIVAYGQRRKNECSPELIWVEAKPKAIMIMLK